MKEHVCVTCNEPNPKKRTNNAKQIFNCFHFVFLLLILAYFDFAIMEISAVYLVKLYSFVYSFERRSRFHFYKLDTFPAATDETYNFHFQNLRAIRFG